MKSLNAIFDGRRVLFFKALSGGKRNIRLRHQLRHLLFRPFSGHVLILVGAALLVRSDLYDLNGAIDFELHSVIFAVPRSQPFRVLGHWEAASRSLRKEQSGALYVIFCREFDVVILKTIPHFLTYVNALLVVKDF